MAQPLEEWPAGASTEVRLGLMARRQTVEAHAGRGLRVTPLDAHPKRTQQAKRRGGNVRSRLLNEGEESEAIVIQFRRDA